MILLGNSPVCEYILFFFFLFFSFFFYCLRGHNWVHFAHRIVYCYVEFKLLYLKNQKLFLIRVKELFEPISSAKKARQVFALFKSIFLRNRSLSNARWIYDKRRKTGKGNLYLTESRWSWNEMYCAADNHNYVSCTKFWFLRRPTNVFMDWHHFIYKNSYRNINLLVIFDHRLS